MNTHFGLYLILTDPITSYEACAEAAVAENIRFLQLRMKKASTEEVIDMGKRIKEITRGSNTSFIVNDHLDIAIACDADGIHLGQSDLSIAEAKKYWDPQKIYGLSTHSMQQATVSLECEADYIGIGPVFPTQTKADTAPVVGPSETGRIAQAIPIPSVAIGGINTGNLAEVLQAGAKNYCVVSAVNRSPSPRESICALQQIWKKHVI